MGFGIRALAAASGAMIVAGTAAAETYRIHAGQFHIQGAKRPILGHLELSPSAAEDDSQVGLAGPTVLSVDDFRISAARLGLFTPAAPVEYEGLVPVAYLTLADQIHLGGPRVTLLRLRSGGELVAESEDVVTFRFVELRADDSLLGSASIRSTLPRRIAAAGSVHRIDQSFRIRRDDDCFPTIPLPGGGVGSGSGGVVIGNDLTDVSWDRFDTYPQETVLFERPASGVLNLVAAGWLGASTIRGELHGAGSVVLLNPTGVALASVAASEAAVEMVVLPTGAPTLEELGMRAPDGATVTLDGNGLLRVETEGDLFVEGPFPEIPGLTSVFLRAGGDIRVTDGFRLPEGVTLGLHADGSVELEDGAEPGPTPPIGVPGLCNGLLPIRPAEEQTIGSFWLVASALRQVPIDVMPWNPHNRIAPGARQPLAIALLGSPALDVRDVDPGSLRVGEARPLRGRQRPRVLRVNGDAHPDLLVFFDVREAEVAWGDTELCLRAQTDAGTAIEGCDAIQTLPPAWQPARRGLAQRWAPR